MWRSGQLFVDRADAGRQLAMKLARRSDDQPIVLALPRGGVPVGYEVAVALDLPLDVILVRKLGVPYQPELAMGAIGEGDVIVKDDATVRRARVSDDQWRQVIEFERAELTRRATLYRSAGRSLSIRGRTALIVDDGIATGSTARAACQIARAHGAAAVVLAVPVAPHESVRRLASDADEVVTVAMPRNFGAIGFFYEDFRQTSDEEVVRLLADA